MKNVFSIPPLQGDKKAEEWGGEGKMDGGMLRKAGLTDCGEPSSPTLGCEI